MLSEKQIDETRSWKKSLEDLTEKTTLGYHQSKSTHHENLLGAKNWMQMSLQDLKFFCSNIISKTWFSLELFQGGFFCYKEHHNDESLK